MSNDNDNENRLARPPGNQGARFSAGNQADNEKLATGMNRHKRKYSSSTVDADCPSPMNSWPRFLIIKAVQTSGIDQNSSITISRDLENLVGKLEMIKRLKDDRLLVKCFTPLQSETLLKTTTLFLEPMEVFPHHSLNNCKGVIISHESAKCTDNELNEWLSDFDVVSVRRCPPRADSTQTLILTFKGNSIPEKVSVGFEWCRVRPYIPLPRRCYKCHKYGHLSHSCTRKAICGNCGSQTHIHSKDSQCTLSPCCVNCDGNHAAFDRCCPKWAIEYEVQKLKVTKNVSFPVARKLIEQTTRYASFADVIKSSENMTPKTRQYSQSLTFSPTKSGMSPRSTPRKRLQLEPGTVLSKYKKCKIPSDEDSYDESAIEIERSSTSGEQVQEIQNESFEAALVDTDEDQNHSDTPDEMESETTKTKTDTMNEGIPKKEPKVFTNEQLLLKFLNCHLDILPETRQRLVKNYLEPTCELLLSHGMNRSILNLDRRSRMNMNDIPKEIYKKKTDVLAALKSRQFSEDEYGMLCLLCIHELYTVAIGIAKKLKK